MYEKGNGETYWSVFSKCHKNLKSFIKGFSQQLQWPIAYDLLG